MSKTWEQIRGQIHSVRTLWKWWNSFYKFHGLGHSFQRVWPSTRNQLTKVYFRPTFDAEFANFESLHGKRLAVKTAFFVSRNCQTSPDRTCKSRLEVRVEATQGFAPSIRWHKAKHALLVFVIFQMAKLTCTRVLLWPLDADSAMCFLLKFEFLSYRLLLRNHFFTFRCI